MKRYKKDELKQELQRNLKADENTLKSWLEDPFYIDGNIVSEFQKMNDEEKNVLLEEEQQLSEAKKDFRYAGFWMRFWASHISIG